MLTFSEPKVITRPAYLVVGCYAPYEGDDERPGWSGATKTFFEREKEIGNRADDLTLGFLYRPHRDHPEIDEAIKTCFIGAKVTDLDHIPADMATTRFPGGEYVVMSCRGDSEDEAAGGVGEAITMLMNEWITANGYVEGDACFACSPPASTRPPYIEYVYIHIEPARL